MSGVIYHCGVLVLLSETIVIGSCGDSWILLVSHNPRSVIAFKLHDDFNAVAKVVDRQRFAKRKIPLVVTTNDPTLKGDKRLIPEEDFRLVFLPVPVSLFSFLGIRNEQESFVFKHMAFLDCLHLMFAFRNTQFKRSLGVGCDSNTIGVGDGFSVHLELNPLHRNAGVFIIHIP